MKIISVKSFTTLCLNWGIGFHDDLWFFSRRNFDIGTKGRKLILDVLRFHHIGVIEIPIFAVIPGNVYNAGCKAYICNIRSKFRGLREVGL